MNKQDKDKIGVAFNLALAQFGSMMIDESRGDEKMVQDGKEYIRKSMDFFDSLFRVKPNFPFHINERIKYRHRIKDKNGYLTDKFKWFKGSIVEFGNLGYLERPAFIKIKFDNDTGERLLDYWRAIDFIKTGKLIKND